jgi:acetate kinase
MFKIWLGIPEIFHYIGIEILDHNGSTVIEMENPFMSEDPRHDVMNSIIENATEKFESHVGQIGQRIVRGIEEYFSDENIEQKIEDGLDYEFAEEGHIVNI